MIDKIKELRALRPIPLSEAKQLLQEHDNDIETCIYLYTAKAIREICEQTSCDSQKAEKYYNAEKYDINRAISVIKDEIYDLHYQAIDGVNHESLEYIKDWVYVMETKNFGTSLAYIYLPKAIETLLLIPKLSNIGEQLKEVKSVYDRIFKDYSDDKPLDQFVKLHRRLDDEPLFVDADKEIPLQVLYIKNEVSRHWRNT